MKRNTLDVKLTATFTCEKCGSKQSQKLDWYAFEVDSWLCYSCCEDGAAHNELSLDIKCESCGAYNTFGDKTTGYC